MLDFIYSVRWRDFLDIFILTVIIYRIILMLQGTRTVQILIGLLVLAAFFYVVDFLNLSGISWVLRNIFNSIVIVFIILFQSDIKNALAQMGTKTTFDIRAKKTSKIIDELYKVCRHFSKRRIGALIVLENEMGLAGYCSNAVKLDAYFSPRLLASLFNHQSPLHDGAVIIDRNNKVAYAGCILPLSAEIDLEKNPGTRHRAALGLSEESDAVILVVSEETGQISLASGGELTLESKRFSIKNTIERILGKDR